MKATSCMITPVKEATPYFRNGRWKTAEIQPTGLVMHFEGKGIRRVYVSSRTGRHLVKLNKRWVKVDITTLTTEEKPVA